MIFKDDRYQIYISDKWGYILAIGACWTIISVLGVFFNNWHLARYFQKQILFTGLNICIQPVEEGWLIDS